MAYNFYTEFFGPEYAYKKVRILDPNTGAPAVIKDSISGVVISSVGESQLDSAGTLRVYIDTSTSWIIRIDGSGVIYKLSPLFLRESSDGSYQYVVDNEGYFKSQLLTPAEVQAVLAALGNGPVTSVAGFTGDVTRVQLAIDHVDNTADLDKPVSTATATALALKYEKPSLGIPATDLSSDVNSALNKANTAIQTESVTSVQGKTGDVILTPSDLSLEGLPTYTAEQIAVPVEAPVGIRMDPIWGQVMVGSDGIDISVDNQPTIAAGALGATLREVLSAMADSVRDIYGTSNQINVDFSTTGVATFSTPQDIAPSSSPVFQNLQINKLKLGPLSPSFILGAGFGAGATLTSQAGNDLKVKVTITSGTNCSGSDVGFTIQFAEAYAALPLVEIYPYNLEAKTLMSMADSSILTDDSISDGTSVTFLTGINPPLDSTVYTFILTFTSL